MLSFIVPAHDEEADVGATVRSIVSAAQACGAAHEVVVVDDASTDRTAERAAAAGARVVHVEVRHIAAARNAGAKAALGDTFVFVDADTLIAADVVEGLRKAMAEGAVGGGAAIRFDEPVPRWVKLLLPASIWLARQFRFTGGCFLFASRTAFEAVGGFDETLYAARGAAVVPCFAGTRQARDPARIGPHLGPEAPHLLRVGDRPLDGQGGLRRPCRPGRQVAAGHLVRATAHRPDTREVSRSMDDRRRSS